MGKGFARRDLIRLAGSAAGLGASGQVLAQGSDTLELFGVPVPRKLVDKMVAKVKPLDRVRTIAAILDLEQRADAKLLPLSPLTPANPQPMVSDDGSFYQSTLPRLVALIDRAEEKDPETAEKAGEILADVHASERVVPDALKPDPAPVPLSTSRKYAELREEYARLFGSLTVREAHQDAVDWQAKLIAQSRLRYEAVAAEVQVPWYFIGAIHGLEASYNFRAHLHNGDFPLAQRTRQVPAGRPAVWLPPSDWESSAKDAIRLLGFANQSDWGLERTLYRLEAYNGFGYRSRRVPTPYLWAFSNHYEAGKFVADGRWSPTAKSRQCGAAVLIKTLADQGEIKLG